MKYIGSTTNYSKRIKTHIKHLKEGNHHNYKLQKDWDIHGERMFQFLIIKRFTDESFIEVLRQEYKRIKSFKFYDLYNIKRDDPRLLMETIKRKKKKKDISRSILNELKQIMATETFKIVTIGAQSGHTIQEVRGRRIEIRNVQCFIFMEYDEDRDGASDMFNVSHLETGHKIVRHVNRDKAIKAAIRRIDNYPEAIEKGLERCKKIGVKLPVNIT